VLHGTSILRISIPGNLGICYRYGILRGERESALKAKGKARQPQN
jgi:hypothetical protein